MFKTLLIAITTAVCAGAPALAQNALNSTADGGAMWHDAGPTLNGGGAWADYTGTQGASDPRGPQLEGSASGFGSGGAATGAPFPGSFIAPANLALAAERKRSLPPTRLDSIVFSSGYADDVFGDEGTWGPPPYSSFGTIDRGVHATTGHQSDAPSAWY